MSSETRQVNSVIGKEKENPFRFCVCLFVRCMWAEACVVSVYYFIEDEVIIIVLHNQLGI